jgi:hypothetical protein
MIAIIISVRQLLKHWPRINFYFVMRLVSCVMHAAILVLIEAAIVLLIGDRKGSMFRMIESGY